MFSSKDLFFTPTSGAYTVSKSLRFRSSATAYLSKSWGAAGNRQKWTWSGWVKRGKLGAYSTLFAATNTTTDANNIEFTNSDTLRFILLVSGSFSMNLVTTQVFRDPSAWYHLVIVYDSAQATSSNRAAIYVNGVQITSFGTSTYPAQSTNGYINGTTYTNYIGYDSYLDGYLAEVNFIDGQALTPSSFGAYDTNGVWQPAAYTGNYGTNGFYLKFTDVGATSGSNSGYGKDFSTNTNYWTTNNFGTTSTATTYDSMLDSPTNATGDIGNYPTLNPLSFNSSNVVDGNLAYLGANLTSTRATFAMPTSGKWYWELTPVNASPNYIGLGLMGLSTTGATNFGNVAANSWGMYPTTNMFLSINGSSVATGIATPGLGVVFAAAYDADTGNFWIGYSSSGSGSPTWFNSTGGTTGNPATGANPMATIAAQTLFPAVSGNNTTTDKGAINFGQRPFALTVPSGFFALNTQNLTTPTITNGAQYMAAVLYNGTSASNTVTATTTNSGNNPLPTTFQPDLVWIKSRSAATDHKLTDVVRGVTKALISDTSGAETTDTNGLTAFTSSGFTVGSDSNYNNGTGPATYVAWEWKASGSTATISPAGTIAATGSVNQTAGFSVVQFTATGSNATVGHGLGVTPSMVIVKDAASAGNWAVWHTSLTSGTYYLFMNTTAAQANTSAIWTAAPDSSVVKIGTWHTADRQIMYCFAPVAGYSVFGSYTGNASTDGPFVYCGFRPRWIMIKSSTATTSWLTYDTSRDTYNVTINNLRPNTSDAESSQAANYLDILSNGFKLRGDGTGSLNASSTTYIYAAFAENPFKISRAR